MFNNKKVESLEQSIATLTEELNNEKEAISNLLECLKKTNEYVDKLQSEKDELEKKYNSLANNLSGYAEKVSEEFKRVYKANEELASEIKEVSKELDVLKEKSNNADAEHSTQIKTLCDNNDRLIAKCEELQLSNVQIMNEHRDMIKRYEEDIKAYQTQTQNMKDNILKKMNANNIISVVEE